MLLKRVKNYLIKEFYKFYSQSLYSVFHNSHIKIKYSYGVKHVRFKN